MASTTSAKMAEDFVGGRRSLYLYDAPADSPNLLSPPSTTNSSSSLVYTRKELLDILSSMSAEEFTGKTDPLIKLSDN
ncbi:unnamed protein product [Bursaphelenchus okinawaensis]|uniref:Uncharacterized protein n=1 Tax=Bursaphelenchus okinawaensis TaxID=465554 RepID=A0A811JTL3_9BILA|nr:unnamed protein product [Bursaphelenchus okinawaensis]CAG9082415.1 unnamed protein product [Bursaphelenchus okinawaensis]